jgi:hypothetical protein
VNVNSPDDILCVPVGSCASIVQVTYRMIDCAETCCAVKRDPNERRKQIDTKGRNANLAAMWTWPLSAARERRPISQHAGHGWNLSRCGSRWKYAAQASKAPPKGSGCLEEELGVSKSGKHGPTPCDSHAIAGLKRNGVLRCADVWRFHPHKKLPSPPKIRMERANFLILNIRSGLSRNEFTQA